MRKRALVKRYARALVGMAAQAGELHRVGEELSVFASFLRQNPELSTFFQNPSILLKDKQGVLEALARRVGLSPLTRGFLSFLVEQARLSELPGICLAYEELADEHLGRLRAAVTSPVPLRETEAERLQERLQESVGKVVYLETSIDPSILGGLIVQVKSTIYDGSLRTQLARMREQLLS